MYILFYSSNATKSNFLESHTVPHLDIILSYFQELTLRKSHKWHNSSGLFNAMKPDGGRGMLIRIPACLACEGRGPQSVGVWRRSAAMLLVQVCHRGVTVRCLQRVECQLTSWASVFICT